MTFFLKNINYWHLQTNIKSFGRIKALLETMYPQDNLTFFKFIGDNMPPYLPSQDSQAHGKLNSGLSIPPRGGKEIKLFWGDLKKLEATQKPRYTSKSTKHQELSSKMFRWKSSTLNANSAWNKLPCSQNKAKRYTTPILTIYISINALQIIHELGI